MVKLKGMLIESNGEEITNRILTAVSKIKVSYNEADKRNVEINKLISYLQGIVTDKPNSIDNQSKIKREKSL